MKTRDYLLISVLILLFAWLAGCGKDSGSPTSPKTHGYKVAGKAVDKDGTGIDGLTVRMFGINYAVTSTTTTAGSFGFDDVAPGSYSIEIKADNLVFKPSVCDVSVSESSIDSLIFTEVNNLIHGRVIDIITNEGMTDIPVFIQQENSHTVFDSTRTDSKGRYEFYDVPADDYSFHLDITWQNKGDYSYSFLYLTHDAFTGRVLSGPEFYMSSEKLQLTLVNYSEDTNIVHLEWTKSKSNFCTHYALKRYGQLLFGTGNGPSDFYESNSVFIEITPKYRAAINNAKTIYFEVCASYSDFGWLTSPYSDPVSIKVAE